MHTAEEFPSEHENTEDEIIISDNDAQPLQDVRAAIVEELRISRELPTTIEIKRNIKLAKLIEEVLKLDMSEVSDQELENIFTEFENDEIALRLLENIQILKRLKEQYSDDQLFNAFYGFRPVGEFSISLSPVSFTVRITDEKDWEQIAWRHSEGELLSGMHSFGLTKKDEVYYVDSIWTEKPGQSTKDHEQTLAHEKRHSVNSLLVETEDEHRTSTYQLYKFKQPFPATLYDWCREKTIANAKDEILAYMESDDLETDKRQTVIDVYGTNYSPLSDGYFASVEGRIEEDLGINIETFKRNCTVTIDMEKMISDAQEAVRIIEEKGHSRTFALSYLCIKENFDSDWIELANSCMTMD